MVDVDELAVRHPADLTVPARNPRIIETDITLDAATDDRDFAVQRIFTLLPASAAVRPGLGGDDEAWYSRNCRAGSSGTASTGHRARVGRGDAAADAEHSDVEIAGFGEAHTDRPDEGVALLGRMLTDHLGQLVAKRSVVGGEPGEVATGKLDGELVGDEYPVRTGRAPVVGLSGQRAGDLDRFDASLEDLGERAFDEAAQAALEAL